MSQITTHVLDTQSGKPASGVPISLSQQTDDEFVELATGLTDADGRITNLLKDDHVLQPGIYKMTFQIEEYFSAKEQATFYPYASIVFKIVDQYQHYHIPLLLSPFGYTTYRGS